MLADSVDELSILYLPSTEIWRNLFAYDWVFVSVCIFWSFYLLFAVSKNRIGGTTDLHFWGIDHLQNAQSHYNNIFIDLIECFLLLSYTKLLTVTVVVHLKLVKLW